MQDMHIRNMQIQDLVEENEDLRARLGSFQELQQCADELLYKLEAAKKRENEAVAQSDHLKRELAELERQNQKLASIHAQEMRFVINQHDRMFEQKDSQMQCLKVQLDQNQTLFSTLERQLVMEKNKQKQLSQNNESSLKKYERQLRDYELELAEVADLFKQEKMFRAQDNEKFDVSIREEKRSSSKLKQEVEALKAQIQKMQEDNMVLTDYAKRLETDLRTKEEEMISTILQLKKNIEVLSLDREKLLHLKNDLQDSNDILRREIEDVKRLEARLIDENQTMIIQKDRLITILKESDNQTAYLKGKLSDLQEAIDRATTNYKHSTVKMIEENSILIKKQREDENIFNKMRVQLKETAQIKITLQATLNQMEAELTSLTAQFVTTKGNFESQRSKNNLYENQIKKLKELVNSLKSENANLEDTYNRLMKEIEILEKEKTFIENNSKQQALMGQMAKMMASFKEEREEQAKLARIEKEKQRKNFQYQLKDLEGEYLKQIASLKEHLQLNKQFQTLKQKNSNIYTASKY